MKTPFTYLALLLALLSAWTLPTAHAQTVYVPVAVTGYTADVIANGPGTVMSSTTNTVDRGNSTVKWCFANHTFTNPAGVSLLNQPALPDNGLITSISTPGLTFQLAAANVNNSLRIDGAASGTLLLTTPQPCSEVMVLATEGNGNTQGKTFTVNFTDGTTQPFSNIVVPDWFNGTVTPAILVGSRVGYVDNAVDVPTTNPRLYEVRLSLSVANYSKLVQSVSVSKTSTDPVLNVMGISLGSNCLGVPTAGTAAALPATVCAGSTTSLSLTGNTVSGGITYQWQVSTNGGTTWTDIAGATTNPYIVRPTATAQYRARVTCSLQASNSLPVTVTVAPTTAIVAYNSAPGTPANFCAGGTAPVVTATPVGGRFSSNSAGLVIDPVTGTLNLTTSLPGTYTVTYAVTTPCPATGTTTVSVTQTVAAVAYSLPSYCRSGSAGAVPAVTPAGGTFSSTTGLVINAATGAINLPASLPGTYTVTYVSGGLCPGTATTTLTVTETVARLAYTSSVTQVPLTFCQTGTVAAVTATPAGGRFSSGSGLVIDAVTGLVNLGASTPGAYTVTYALTAPCPASATVALVVAPPAGAFSYTCPPFYQNGTPAVPTGAVGGGVFSAPAGLTINPTTGVVDLTTSVPGTYNINLTTAAGCMSTTSFQVVDKLIFPNVITPNGDGKNDVLRPNLANVTNFRMQVYSRWGRKVYESTDPSQGWTATENSAGMYYYQILYTDCTGTAKALKSYVEVMK